MIGERSLTERAQTALALAREEARLFGHEAIGTEHLLLGLIREGDGIAALVLASLDAALARTRDVVEFVRGRGDHTIEGDINLTPRAAQVVASAGDEARRLEQRFVGTEHLLLALLRDGETLGAAVLERLGVTTETARAGVIETIGLFYPGAALAYE